MNWVQETIDALENGTGGSTGAVRRLTSSIVYDQMVYNVGSNQVYLLTEIARRSSTQVDPLVRTFMRLHRRR